jgi:hypothetical protein
MVDLKMTWMDQEPVACRFRNVPISAKGNNEDA